MPLSRRDLFRAGAAAVAAVQPARPAERPNILLLLSDQQHWRALGFQDPFFRTPHLDKLAAQSAVFERAFCTTPQCSPSRSSLFTGLYPSKTGVMGNVGSLGGSELAIKTFGARLQEAGYQTAYFGKWHLGENPAAVAGWSEESRRLRDPEVTEHAVRFLESDERKKKPFLLAASHLDPHDVYHYDAGSRDISKESIPLPVSWRRETFQGKPAVQKEFMTADQGRVIWGRPERDWQEYRDLYREKVALYDSHAGRILDALRRSGLWENTIVVMSTDHGDMDTHHRLIYKGPFMYEQMVRIPLIVRVPASFGGSRPSRVKDFDAVNVDIAPTLLEFAGVRRPESDGLSLKPLLTGSGSRKRRDFVIGQYYGKQRWVNPIRMIRTEEFKHNVYIDHGEELYDLRNDPGEIVNLAADAGYAVRKRELRAELDRWIEVNKDPFYSLRTTRLTPSERKTR